MAVENFIDIEVTDSDSGAVASAWSALRLVVNVQTGKAHVVEAGWKDGQHLADEAETCIKNVVWTEPNIEDVVLPADYTAGTSIFDVVNASLIARMSTLDYIPGTDTVNPFKGCTITPIPSPSS